MGDVVQSLGALQAMHAMRPRFEFCFVTQRENAPLLQGLAGLAHVIEHDRHGGLAAILHTRSRLRALRCDVALDFQGNLKSALCAWLSGARERIGAAGSARREPWSRALLTKTVAIAGPFHPAFVASCVARALVPDAPFLPGRLCATDDEVQAAADFVRAAGINPSAAFTVLLLGRPEDPRSLQHAAIRAELERDRPVLLLAGPSEHDVLAPEGVPMWRQTRGQLRVLVGLGALLARVGGFLVGADQGPAHVLAAAGAPTSILFGPQDPTLTAPPTAQVLQHPTPPSCMPCRERKCRHPNGPVCMAFTRAQGRPHAEPVWLRAAEP